MGTQVPPKKGTVSPWHGPQESQQGGTQRRNFLLQRLADAGPRSSLANMGTVGFLTQPSLSSEVTDRWAHAWHGANLTQGASGFCGGSFIRVNV